MIFQNTVEMIEHGQEALFGQRQHLVNLLRAIHQVQAKLLRAAPVSDTVEATMQVSVSDHIIIDRFLQGDAGQVFDSAEVFVIAAELQAFQVIPVVNTMPHPGSHFGVIQIAAVESCVHTGTEVWPEHWKGLPIEAATLD